MFIEYIATTIEDAITIQNSGADRIELVTALTEGGLTPSYGLIEGVVNSVKIPVNVMVRPHSHSFLYSAEEIRWMKREIEIIRSIGANGVVIGVLNKNREIDQAKLEDLLSVCDGLEVTFHRAIDETRDLIQAVKTLAEYKEIQTILTSGGYGNLINRLQTIQRMNQVRKDLSILVGSGLTKENIVSIHSEVQTGYYHFGTAIRKEKRPILPVDLGSAREIVSLLKGQIPDVIN